MSKSTANSQTYGRISRNLSHPEVFPTLGFVSRFLRTICYEMWRGSSFPHLHHKTINR
jgi:hypothetical protein